MIREISLRQSAIFETSDDPLVTLITVTYNAERHIAEAIKSVAAQTYPHIEHIVIDGGSTDNTLEIIKANSGSIGVCISEPDDGIYNAMNKGICRASGEIIGLVNADDVIYPDAVEQVVGAFLRDSEAGFTIAPVELAQPDGTVFGVIQAVGGAQLRKRIWKEMPCAHQGIYVRREIYNSVGLFNESYPLRADYDFLIRLLEANIPCVQLEEPVGFFRLGGRSGGMEMWLETRRLWSAHGQPRLGIELRFLYSFMATLVSTILPWPLMKQVKRFKRGSRLELY